MQPSQVSAVATADGSSTLYCPRHKALYHSSFGAITESRHVFIDAALGVQQAQPVAVLEVGLGTGLNAALTAAHAQGRGLRVQYQALELYPLTPQELALLNYGQVLDSATARLWVALCSAPWGVRVRIGEHMEITKINADYTRWAPAGPYHAVYFDAFAPGDQPEMWGGELFRGLHGSMCPGGVLTTYCVRGEVRRALSAAGFRVERLPGPPGKRHMLRAWRA